jgi:hypothetical protein
MAGRPLTDAGILARQYGVNWQVIDRMAMHVIPMTEDARTVMIAQSKAFGTYPHHHSIKAPRSPSYRPSKRIRSEQLAKLSAEIAQRMTGDPCAVHVSGVGYFRIFRSDASGRIDVI